jgi:homoserine O-acetyltransferase
MGIDSDLLYPLIEQQELAALIPGSIMNVIHTHNGHDGFLLEQDQVSEGIKALLCSL